MKQLFLWFWFFPKRAYYASYSPEKQFSILIDAIKKEKPTSYCDFENMLRKRFETITYPMGDFRFCIDVGEQKQLCAHYEVDDWDEGLKWVNLSGPEGRIKGYKFGEPYGFTNFD